MIRPERMDRFTWGPNNPPIFLGKVGKQTPEQIEAGKEMVRKAKEWLEAHREVGERIRAKQEEYSND